MFFARRKRSAASVRRKLFVETLESRVVLATYNWVAGVPGDWDVAANWRDQDNLPGIPGAGDDAKFTEVVTSTVSRTVNSLNSGFGGLHVTGGTFAISHTVGPGSFLSGLVLDSGAALGASGEQLDLFGSEISGNLISEGIDTTIRFARLEDLKVGAQLTGTGTFLIEGDTGGGPTVNIEAAANIVTSSKLKFSGGASLTGPGTLTIGGSAVWNSMTMSGTGQTIVQPGATLNITGGVILSQRTLINNGQILFSGAGNLDVTNNGTIDNRGSLEIATDRAISGIFPTGTLINSGTITKTTSPGTATLQIVLNNTGTVDVQTGTLNVQRGISDNATYVTAAGATLTLAGTFRDTLTLQGTGTVIAGAGEVVIGGNGATFAIAPGLKFNFAGGPTIVPVSATLNLNGTVRLPSASDYTIRGGGTVNLNGVVLQTGLGNLLLGADLATNSIPTTFVIPAGRSYNIFKDSGILAVGGILENRGTIRKSAGAGVSLITARLLNSGSILAVSGSLRLHQVNSTGGTINTAAGTTVSLGFNGASFFKQVGALNLTGAGTVTLVAGALEAAVGGATFQVAAGSIFDWSGGAIVVSPGDTAMINGNFRQSAASTVTLTGGGTLNFNGNVTQTGAGNLRIDGGVGTATTMNILAGRTYAFASNSGLEQGGAGGGVVNNNGILRKTAGAGVSFVTPVLAQAANITVDTGTLALRPAGGVVQGGVFTVATGAVLDLASFGTTTMTGTFSGNGAGEVRLAGGAIVAAGGGTGLTFVFPNGLFKINGGTINTNLLEVRIKGAISVVGVGDSAVTGGGTFIVEGTLTQSTTGNMIVAGSTTLNVPVGGVYNLVSDGDIVNGGGVLNIDGTLRKSNGNGLSTINVPITNSGTVEARRGILQLSGGISEFVAGSLNGGTWSALSTAATTATLNLGVNVTTIGLAAKVILSGPNSSLLGIGNLAVVQGSFSLFGGAAYANSGSLQNNGKILLSATSTLDVSGNYTQGGLGQVTYQGTATSIGRLRTLNNVSLSGKLLVSFIGQPTLNTSMTIIENQGGNPVSGTFVGLANNATFVANGMTFRINYGFHVLLTRIA